MSARASTPWLSRACSGGQVVGRPQHVLVVGHRQRGRSSSVKRASPRSSTLTTFLLIDQQVGRLDVAMDQAGMVGVGQAFGRLADVLGGHGVAPAGRPA